MSIYIYMLLLVLLHPFSKHSHSFHDENCHIEQVHVESSEFDGNPCFICDHLTPFTSVLGAVTSLLLIRQLLTRLRVLVTERQYYSPQRLHHLRGPPQF